MESEQAQLQICVEKISKSAQDIAGKISSQSLVLETITSEANQTESEINKSMNRLDKIVIGGGKDRRNVLIVFLLILIIVLVFYLRQ